MSSFRNFNTVHTLTWSAACGLAGWILATPRPFLVLAPVLLLWLIWNDAQSRQGTSS